MKGTNKGKRLSMLAAGALIIGMALTAGFIGCENEATDVNIVDYSLPDAAGPADLTVRHSELTAGYDFGSSKSGSITLTVSSSYTSQGTTTSGYTATGTFTDSFGVGYAASGYVTSSPVGSSGGNYYSGTFYGTIGGKTNSVYVSGYGIITLTGATYTLTDTSVSANVLEPAASLYVVSYKKAALDASHSIGYRFAGKNTFNYGAPSSSVGFASTGVSGYPVKNDLTVDYTAVYDSDLVTYIISANDFLNGDVSTNTDGSFKFSGWNGIDPRVEFEFGFENTQTDHKTSYTWVSPTLRR